ncbi:MAG: thioredoxin-dependent thiol peroxidase [Chitinophagaceae bacterium]|nr:thioredoxin-dependent thiol peroxidase [Chitinophagaceae bacterium]MBP8243828.1 thioredoxin-dependent thiol peroxidase [Chitinophagaceae bacterium]
MAVTLKEGDPAPVFSGKDQDGKKVSLKDYKGKMLLLYFYSEAGTPTCTLESCNLRDHYKVLLSKGIEVLGVSPDTISRQKKFEEKYRLPFRLMADEEHQITSAYGVRGMKKLFGREYMGILRTSFLIDEKGKILRVFHKPRNKAHAEEVLASLGK